MFSTCKNLGKAKNSERETEKKDLTLNLSVCGSPVPIYRQQPKHILRECKIHKRAPKESKRNDIQYPVDKIIYLTQRLELTSLTAKKIKSISLSALNTSDEKSSEKIEKMVSCSCSRMCETKQHKRSNEISSSDFDFSLDLSSIVNTADESDENSVDLEEEEEEEEVSSHFNGETSNSQFESKELLDDIQVIHSANRISTKSCEIHDFLLRDQPGKPKPSSYDLINVYINSVNNQQDLVKYLRPCYTCKEPCCVCPDSPSRTHLCPAENTVRLPPSRFYSTARKDGSEFGDSRFVCECTSCPFLRKRLWCSEFCCREIPEPDLCTAFCKEGCKFRSDPFSQRASDDSVNSDRILAYTSSLANAAKSARVLAKDLESILSSLNNDAE